MLFSTLISGLGLFTSLASASPAMARRLAKRQSSQHQVVAYWGQNGGGTIENNDLAAYCTPTSGIDVLVLAFLYQFGGSHGNVASGIIGQSCFITNDGQPQNCDALTAAIATCKANGIKIILSLGGAVGSYSLTSDAQAAAIGQYLWDAYGGSSNSAVTRPLGNIPVDGWDFDIETNGGSSQYYPAMIKTLRQNFASDPSRTYRITGAPQCPIPEPNMSPIIEGSVFDWLFIQFYNNNNYTVPCALGINGDAPMNFNNWTNYLAGTPSKGATLFIGVPASEDGANGTPQGAAYYATPDQLAGIVGDYENDSNFGGIMMWSAGFSDANVNNGCTYAQEAYKILRTGSPCTNGPISSGNSSSPVPTVSRPPPTSTPKPTASSSSASVTATPTATPGSGNGAGGTVTEWNQCGGQGYTGPTQCVAGLTCVAQGIWWSSCQKV